MVSSQSAQMGGRDRIEFIDGLRGVAILMVLLFHAYARWPNLYVYGDTFVGNPVFNTGIAGVRLFFVISGFVILMTLHRCSDFFDFMYRRWLRLFPAMLICSALVFITAGLFAERPEGQVYLMNLLPGLTFIGDGHIWQVLGKLVGLQVEHMRGLEGAFWSLYTEVRFYIIFGAAYYLIGERASICAIAAIYALAIVSRYAGLPAHSGAVAAMQTLLSKTGAHGFATFLHAEEYGYFVVGALLFVYHISWDLRVLCLALLMIAISAGFSADSNWPSLFASSLFVAAYVSQTVRRIVGCRLFLVLGFASYPLYLMHENMMVAMIVKIGRRAPEMPPILIPILPIAMVVTLGVFIAKYIEPGIKHSLSRLAGRLAPAAPAMSTMRV